MNKAANTIGPCLMALTQQRTMSNGSNTAQFLDMAKVAECVDV